MLEEQKNTQENSKSKLKVSFKWFVKSLRDLGKEIFSVYDDGTDIKGTVESIKKDTETGYRFSNGNMTKTKLAFHLSDVMVGNNTILAKAGNFSASYLSYSTFNFMHTTNSHFNAQNQDWFNTLMSKSTLLSGVAEKQRNQFFKSAIKHIKELMQYIEDTEI